MAAVSGGIGTTAENSRKKFCDSERPVPLDVPDQNILNTKSPTVGICLLYSRQEARYGVYGTMLC